MYSVQLPILLPASYILQRICIHFVSAHRRENNKPLCKKIKLNFFNITYHWDSNAKQFFCQDFSFVILYSHSSGTELGQCLGLPLCMEYSIMDHFSQYICTQKTNGKVKIHFDIITWVIKEVITKLLLEERQCESLLESLLFICFFFYKSRFGKGP